MRGINLSDLEIRFGFLNFFIERNIALKFVLGLSGLVVVSAETRSFPAPAPSSISRRVRFRVASASSILAFA